MVEVYIDDIVIKIRTHSKHLHHLKEAFDLMRKYDMKLNMLKCAFRVSTRMFLIFKVMQKGIEVSLTQVKVVLETLAPIDKKEV